LVFALALITRKIITDEILVHGACSDFGINEAWMNSRCQKDGLLHPCVIDGDFIQAFRLKPEGFVVVAVRRASRNSPHNMYSFSGTASARFP
jgi:hypothetical protein